MSLETAKEHLKKYKMDNRIMIFDSSSATVKEAAEAIHCEEKEIAKTMSFLVDDQPIVIVLAGDVKIDNAKYKQEFHKKAKMVPSTDLEEIIGHEMGGVGPFGLKENVKVYLDESIKRFQYVYPACGSHNSAIKVTIKELEEITNYEKWVDVAKQIEETL